MQPGGKGRLTTKASNFSKELDEDFLCQVFSFRDVAGHSQAEGVNPAIMPLVELLKSGHIALSRSLRQRVISFLLGLGFGCGHVFVFGLATKSFRNACLRLITFALISKERQPSPGTSEVLVVLNAGVMQRFERVVALPNPKVIEFPAASTLFRNSGLRSNKCDRGTGNQPLPLHARSEFRRNPLNLQWCD